jgi:hypothetical protein
MTTQGLTTSERTTQLNSLFSALFKNSGDASKKFGKDIGEAFSLASLRTKGLTKFLEDLQTATGGNELVLQELLGRTEAVRAVFALTGRQTEKLGNSIEQYATKAGAAAAANEEIKESLDFQLDQAATNFGTFGTAVFEKLEKPLLSLLKTFNKLNFSGNPYEEIDNIDKASKNVRALEMQLKAAEDAEGSFFSTFTADIDETKGRIELLTAKIKELSEQEPLVLAPEERGQDDPTANLITQRENFVTISAAQQEKITAKNKAEAEKRLAIEQEVLDQKLKDEAAARLKREEEAKKETEARVAREKKALEQIALLNQQQAILNEEARLLDNDFKDQQEEEKFLKLEESLGRDQAVRLTAEQNLAKSKVEIKKAEIATNKALLAQRVKDEKNSLNTIFSAERNVSKDKVANFKSTLGSISTLQKSSNKEAFAIGKAASIATATVDGVAAVQKALASAPVPFNFALAALVGTATALNISKIASSKPPAFQEGGFVSPSLPRSGDFNQVRVNGDEFIANRPQQRNILEAVANGGALGGGSFEEAIETLGDRLTEQPIMVMLDNKEIARATRVGVREGIAI